MLNKTEKMLSQARLIADINALNRLIARDGCPDEVGGICGRNPDAARWLVDRMAVVHEKSEQFGRPTDRLKKYVIALDLAMTSSKARERAHEILDEIESEKLGDLGVPQ